MLAFAGVVVGFLLALLAIVLTVEYAPHRIIQSQVVPENEEEPTEE